MKRYQFLSAALEEYEDAIVYYERMRSGLGASFILDVERVLAQALEFPEIGTPVADTPSELSVRRRLLRRFGVEIDYMLTGDTVVVLAVFHGKRRPGYWKHRLARLR
jgi:toxin ParE1/3/4